MLLTICLAALLQTPIPAAPNAALVDPIPVLLRAVDPARPMADVERLVQFHTRHTLSETESDERGIGAARRWLKGRLEEIAMESGGRMQVHKQRFEAKVQGNMVELVNLYGFLPGTEVESLGRTYVVSGHYDSRATKSLDATSFAPGANDDGSGTAVTLEVARVLSKGTFRANLVFLLVPGEEQGLYGAKHFAEAAKAQSWAIDGMFTNDIVGGVEGGNGIRDERTVRCYSPGGDTQDRSRGLARAIAGSAERYVPDAKLKLVFRPDRFGRGGDHQAFFAEGFPALRLTEANEHYARQHQDVREEDGVKYGDVAEYVSADYMGKVARVNAAALAELALAPPTPTGIAMRAAVSYDTQLGWRPSSGDVAKYEIVWRDTISPVWTGSQDVEPTVREQKSRSGKRARRVVQGTVKNITADTCFFGVRAVSSLGHRSRVAVPFR